MRIEVILNGSRTAIKRAVFLDLFENSVVSGRAAYLKALETEQISFPDLIELSRKADIPYSLFFAPHTVVQSQLQAKTAKLLQGVTKDTFSVNSRHTVRLSDIELIIKDLLRKQELLKKHDNTLSKNPIVGLLHKPGTSVESDATKLLNALGLAPEAIKSARSKAAALELIIKRLEARQILVSRSVNNFMPQRLQGVKFSGMTIKDKKVPYVFLAGGDHGDFQEPVGRQIFTLTLMTVLVARGIFAPVTYDGRSPVTEPSREHDIVGEILMPRKEMKASMLTTLDDIKETAEIFKVTPSAIVVRGLRLGMLSAHKTAAYLEQLALEFSNRPKSQPRTPKPVNAVRKYNGRELSIRMLDALNSGKLTAGEFCRNVCLNKIKPSEINDFREALG